MGMEARLRAEPWVMDARRATVEHVFGSAKRGLNQGYLLLRGLGRVAGEVGFTMLVYNLRRAVSMVRVGGLVAYVSADPSWGAVTLYIKPHDFPDDALEKLGLDAEPGRNHERQVISYLRGCQPIIVEGFE